MNLEDQIRRMGDARAAQVATSDWRDTTPGRRWGRWALAGAAALVLLAGLAFVLADDGDDDTEVVGDTDVGELTRWIPASGVTRVDYPGAAAWFPQIYGFSEVALIAPGGDASAHPQTFIRVLGGSSPFQGTSGPAVSYRIRAHDDGLLELDLTDESQERTVASIETSVFTEAELEALAPSLLPVSADMAALTDLLADQRGDLSVVYMGAPVRFDRAIYGDDPDLDDGVLYLDTRSKAHYTASLGRAGRDEVTVAEWFALDSLDDLLLTDEVLGLDDEDAPVVVGEDEWLRILADLIGAGPVVTIAGSDAFAMEDFVPDLADPPTAAVRQGDHWTVALRFAEPTMIRDGGGFTIRVGEAIEVTVELAEPGAEFTSLTSPSRMTRAEADLLVEAINAGATEPVPTTTSPDYPMVDPSDDCSVDIPADASHIAPNRTPLDVDQDGVPDEFLVEETADGHRLHVVLADSSLWVDLVGSVRPRLLDRPEGGAASRDLDGDGRLDFFVSPQSTNGAELVRLGECGGTVHEIGPHEGEWCLRDGGSQCERRIACVDDAVVSDITSGGDVDGDELDESERRWSRTAYRFEDGELERERLESVNYALADTPAGIPSAATTGTVDCVPHADAELPPLTSPGD